MNDLSATRGLIGRIGRTVYVGVASVGQGRRSYLQRWSWQRLQSRRVHQIIRHAATSVPFYRDFMQREGLGREDFRSAEDLARFPLIGRQELLDEPERFFSEAHARDRCFRMRTTGTSGVPAEFWHDQRSMMLNIAYGRRERAVIEAFRISDNSGNLRVAFRHPDSEYYRVHGYYQRMLVDPRWWTDGLIISSSGNPIDENIDLLHRLRPAIVSAAGSYLGPLLLHPKTLRVGGWKPKAAVFTAESPSERDLNRLRYEFDIPVQSLYRSGEALKMGFSCEEQDGLHIHPDLCAVRVVDESGAPVAPGQTGEIVISNLLNRATVLLNYRIGDLGCLDESPCPCGRFSPRIKAIEGRVGEVIQLPNGSILETSIVGSVFKKRDDVARYQIVQRESSFEIRFQPAPAADWRLIEKEVADGYRALLGADAEVEIVVVDHFDLKPGEKYRRVIVVQSEDHPAQSER